MKPRINFFWSLSILARALLCMPLLSSCCLNKEPVILPLPFLSKELYPAKFAVHPCKSQDYEVLYSQEVTHSCMDTIKVKLGEVEYRYEITFYKDRCNKVESLVAHLYCREEDAKTIIMSYDSLLRLHGWLVNDDWKQTKLQDDYSTIATKEGQVISIAFWSPEDYKGTQFSISFHM